MLFSYSIIGNVVENYKSTHLLLRGNQKDSVPHGLLYHCYIVGHVALSANKL